MGNKTRTAGRLTMKAAALNYAKLGWRVLPVYGLRNGHCVCQDRTACDRPGKHPRVRGGASAATSDARQIQVWWDKWPNANIGVATGTLSGIIAIDCDKRNGSAETILALTRKLGPLGLTLKAKTGGGSHRIFRYPPFKLASDTAGKAFGQGIDILSDRSYFVAPPSLHKSGHHYEWSDDGEVSLDRVKQLPPRWAAHLKAAQKSRPQCVSTKQDLVLAGQRNSHLTSLAGTLREKGIAAETIKAALNAENQQRCQPPLADSEIENIAKGIQRYQPSAVTRDPAERVMTMVLKEAFGNGSHLLHKAGRFWFYNGRFWGLAEDDWIKGRVLETIQADTSRSTHNTSGLMSQTLNLLQARQSRADDPFGFEAEPRPIINCANGELWIDQSGGLRLRRHRAKSYLTRCIAASYDEEASCRRYDKAVREIFGAATEPVGMVRHWHELMGYVIQPRRNIPLIQMLLGNGRNGKTRLANTLVQLIGQQVVAAEPIASLEASRFARGNLFGKLLFLDDDVRAGTRLPDGLLKTISEGKTISGEMKFGAKFNFIVRTVPLLLCNNVPSLTDLSTGMLRRLSVIPFGRTFGENEDNRTLFDEIWATELPGILNRAAKGLGRIIMRQHRFKPPADVIAATSRFLTEANPLPAFIDESCSVGSNGRCLMRDFYAEYCRWAQRNGITFAQQQKTVKNNLNFLGYPVRHGSRGDTVNGLVIKASGAPPTSTAAD